VFFYVFFFFFGISGQPLGLEEWRRRKKRRGICVETGEKGKRVERENAWRLERINCNYYAAFHVMDTVLIKFRFLHA
jgi:hypothetical protein